MEKTVFVHNLISVCILGSHFVQLSWRAHLKLGLKRTTNHPLSHSERYNWNTCIWDRNNDAGNYFAGKRKKRLKSGPQVFRAKRLMRLGPLCVGVITGRHRINFGKLRISWVVKPNRISVVRWTYLHVRLEMLKISPNYCHCLCNYDLMHRKKNVSVG